MPGLRGLISSLLVPKTPYDEQLYASSDPLERSAKIDMLRATGKLDPDTGARLSRHAIGSELAHSLPFPLGVPAANASALFFDTGKALGQAFPEQVKGTMWETDPTSSALTAKGAISRILAANQGAVDEYGKQLSDYTTDVKNYFGGLGY